MAKKKLFSRFGRKNKRIDDVVNSAKNFQFIKDIPGLSSDKVGGLTEKLRRLFRGMQKRCQDPEQKQQLKRKAALLITALFFCGSLYGLVKITGIGKISRELVSRIEYFHIKEIKIEGYHVATEQEIKRASGVGYTTSMLTLDEQEVARRIADMGWIEQAEVKTRFPDKLLITVKEYQPTALIALGDEKVRDLYYISSKGMPFSKIKPGDGLDYPVVTGLGSIEEIESAEELKKDIFTFLKQVGRNDPRLPIQSISEIHVNEEHQLVVYLVDHSFPIYMGKGDMYQKYWDLLRVLGVLYKKHQDDFEKVASIKMDYYGDKALVSLKD